MAHPYVLKGPGVALLNGGSTGIGLAYAKQLASRGYDLFLVARGEKALKEAAKLLERKYKQRIWTLSQDMGDSEAIPNLQEFVKKEKMDVAVVVNCAGFGDVGPFIEADERRLVQMVTLNCVTVTTIARAFAPVLAARGGGAILTISSTAAFMPLPQTATYAATKAYVNSLTLALAAELKEQNIGVQAICPGPMGEKNQLDPGPLNTLMDMARMPSDDVAKAGMRGYDKGEVITIPGAANAMTTKLASALGGEVLARGAQFAISRMRGG